MVDQLKMTSPREYTQAHLAAFAWLPSNGAWLRFDKEPSLLMDLQYDHPDLVHLSGWAKFRLTPAGQAEKARLIEEGKIEP